MKGTSTDQDARFGNKEKKLMKGMKFDSILKEKVDMENVMLDTMKTWIAARISKFLGFEDEVVIDYVYQMLETEKFPDPQKMQLHLTGFLEAENARTFMRELWYFLKSAELNGGIPKEFVDLRIAELATKQKEEVLEKIVTTAHIDISQDTEDVESKRSDNQSDNRDSEDEKDKDSYRDKRRYNRRKRTRSSSKESIEIRDKTNQNDDHRTSKRHFSSINHDYFKKPQNIEENQRYRRRKSSSTSITNRRHSPLRRHNHSPVDHRGRNTRYLRRSRSPENIRRNDESFDRRSRSPSYYRRRRPCSPLEFKRERFERRRSPLKSRRWNDRSYKRSPSRSPGFRRRDRIITKKTPSRTPIDSPKQFNKISRISSSKSPSRSLSVNQNISNNSPLSSASEPGRLKEKTSRTPIQSPNNHRISNDTLNKSRSISPFESRRRRQRNVSQRRSPSGSRRRVEKSYRRIPSRSRSPLKPRYRSERNYRRIPSRSPPSHRRRLNDRHRRRSSSSEFQRRNDKIYRRSPSISPTKPLPQKRTEKTSKPEFSRSPSQISTQKDPSPLNNQTKDRGLKKVNSPSSRSQSSGSSSPSSTASNSSKSSFDQDLNLSSLRKQALKTLKS